MVWNSNTDVGTFPGNPRPYNIFVTLLTALGYAPQSGFAVAYLLGTEKFFDLLGSLGFFSIAVASLIYGDFYYARQVRRTPATL